jgi:hypothetical protein
MDTQKILEQLDTLEKNISEKRIKKMNLPLARKVIKRLDEFSKTCNACEGRLNDLSALIEKMSQGSDQEIDKELSDSINDSTAHLQEVHNLVPENHYTNTYMSYGVALGLVFGGGFSQLINQTALIGIGLPIGISMGLAIGSKKDEEAKKEGLQI